MAYTARLLHTVLPVLLFALTGLSSDALASVLNPLGTLEKRLLGGSNNSSINGEGNVYGKKYKFFYIVPSLEILKYTPAAGHNNSRPAPAGLVPNTQRNTSQAQDVLLLAPSFVALGDGTSSRRLTNSDQRRLSVELHKLRHFATIAGVQPNGASGQRPKSRPVELGAFATQHHAQEERRSQYTYRSLPSDTYHSYKSNRYYIYTDPVRLRGDTGERHGHRLDPVSEMDGDSDKSQQSNEDSSDEAVRPDGSLVYHRQARSFNGSDDVPERQKSDRFKRRSAVDDMLSKNITIILENLLKRYENSQMPTHGQGVPTLVETNILIRSMGPVSELDMDYSMDCYFRQYWRDKRLSFRGPIKSLSLSIKMLERIWRPDTYFYNGKHSHVHTITVPNKLLRLSQDGEILYSMRLTIKASCLMELRSFPMDRQSCPLVLGSYAYSRQQLVYQWKDEDSVNFVPGMTLSQFDLMSFGQKNYTFIRREGEFSVLHVSFNLQRHTGYFLIQVYVPCILIVVLSWVSFWIHREATSDRVGLGITTVLTLSTISLDSRTDLPKVRYATALDWFLLMSFFYCIATLLEFAGVHYFTKVGSGEIPLDEEEWEDMEGVEEIRDLPSLQQHLSTAAAIESPRLIAARRRSSLICPIYNDPTHMFKPTSSHLSTMERTTQTEPPKEPTWKQVWLCFLGDDQFRRRRQREASARGGGNRHVNSVSLIDQAARILFPMSFTFFNILYWLVYYTYQADFTWTPLKEV
ncbi:gamma-aminobutyric acid receptor subunit alpha-6 [Anopheles funestus]|uniref:gamma-aminobutyric acid receptor subunit alpha-6 n=1 Tax=Anopheles funestus TaxID=62324 RepID=UPI0020C6E30B|nr:gamma-aminobutyric acid receptor subunit alpha-6 [Anopheles funestus]XP_049286876.1 gamma-aminobutyric acid receptor subunit alpha-6 [Anopheles funestus]